MMYKVAAETEGNATEPEVGSGLRALFGSRGTLARRNVEMPDGTLHAYVEGAPATFCGVATARLALFPNIDWPGGVELSGRHCPRCGEATADQ